MAVARRGIATTQVLSAANPTATSFPAGWQPGDVAFFSTFFNTTTQTQNTPTGWTPIFQNAQSGAADTQGYLYYRVLRPGDTAPDVSLSAVADGLASIIVYSGANIDKPVEASTSSGNAAGTTHEAGTVTTLGPDRMVVTMGSMDIAAVQANNWTPFTGYSKWDETEGSGNQNTAVADKTEAIPAAYSPDWTSVVSDNSLVFTLALLPNFDMAPASPLLFPLRIFRGMGPPLIAGFEGDSESVTALSGTDTATGSETSDVQATVPGADSSSGSDTGTVAATVSGSDSATGTDVQTSIVSPVSGSDSSTGTDAGTVSATAPGSDSATGSEGAVVTETGAGGEGGAGSEAGTVSVTATGSDSGSGTDAGTVVDVTGGPTLVSGSDSGAGSETGSVVDLTPPPPDTGGGADYGDETAIYGEPMRKISDTDSAVGFEVGMVVDLTPRPKPKLPRIVLPPRRDRPRVLASADEAQTFEAGSFALIAAGSSERAVARDVGNVVDLTPEDQDEVLMVMALLFD